MEYKGACIAVDDVKAARAFYEELFGLEVFQDYGICVAFKGGLSLQQSFDWLLGIPKESVVRKSHNMELYFEEDDFDGFAKKLEGRAGITYLGDGVLAQPWGQRIMRFYDLDGHIIEVGENLAAVVRRFLASGMSLEETSKRMDVTVSDLKKLLGA